jgi:hypothetical protein
VSETFHRILIDLPLDEFESIELEGLIQRADKLHPDLQVADSRKKKIESMCWNTKLQTHHEEYKPITKIQTHHEETGPLTARVILKRSDGRRFAVTSRSHLSLYLVLLRGELKIFLVRDVFNRTFTGFLCNPIHRTDTMSIDNELQHLAPSKIVGKVPYKIRRGFRTWRARALTLTSRVPYLQGEDDTEIDGDASGCWETISSSSHEY